MERRERGEWGEKSAIIDIIMLTCGILFSVYPSIILFSEAFLGVRSVLHLT